MNDDTVNILRSIDGGPELIDWFNGDVDFHDAEVATLHLDHAAESFLLVRVEGKGRLAVVKFVLSHWIDVRVDGFSHQNTIEDLVLSRSDGRSIAPWEKGVGLEPGEIEIELLPCFGASGAIRANVKRIELDQQAMPQSPDIADF